MNNKLLASLAVFRELYNNQKDVYYVLSKFIEEIIIHKSIYCFEVLEMKSYLDELFDFQLPDGIIKASAKRLDYVYIENKKFVVDKFKLSQILNTDENKHVDNYENILNDLLKYIADNENIKLDKKIEKDIEKEFSFFLLNGTINNGYSNLISKFIVSNQENATFKKSISLIKEGIILYTGLKYTPDNIELGSWKSNIIIYLDVEILFHAVGYNGKLYKDIFDDFYNLIKDINKNKFLISLKFFPETKNEIENFFKKAEYIVSGQDRLNASVIAMNSIVDGCSSKSDVIEKKLEFYEVLKSYKIEEDENIIHYDEETYKYNIISSELEQELKTKYSQHEIDYSLKLLNNISIKRKEKSSNNFESIGSIILTANSKILRMANNDDIREQGKVPLATNIDFLTTKFWFKLNKGFGDNDYPKTFSIFTKAQIILSTHINENMNKQLSAIQEKIRNNTFTEDKALANLVFLKESVKKPEEITSDSIDEIYLLLNDNSIEEIVNYHEHLKVEVENEKKNKQTLENELINKNMTIDKVNDSYELIKQDLISTKNEIINDLEKRKEKLDKKIDKKIETFKKKIIYSIALYCLTIVVLIILFGWERMEVITYLLGFLPIVFSLIYFTQYEEKFDYKYFIENKRKKFKKNIYEENDFNEDYLNTLKIDLQTLSIK